MTDFMTLARARHSCRKYTEQAIPPQTLTAVLEAGRIAPTAHNSQPYKVFVLEQGSPALEKLRTAGNIYPAPVTLVICGDREAAWQNSFNGWKSTEVDAAIVTDHMMLAAADLGLDSLWICWFDDKVVREALALPEHLVPVNILLLGHSAKEPKSPTRHDVQRKPLSELVTYL